MLPLVFREGVVKRLSSLKALVLVPRIANRPVSRSFNMHRHHSAKTRLNHIRVVNHALRFDGRSPLDELLAFVVVESHLQFLVAVVYDVRYVFQLGESALVGTALLRGVDVRLIR